MNNFLVITLITDRLGVECIKKGELFSKSGIIISGMVSIENTPGCLAVSPGYRSFLHPLFEKNSILSVRIGWNIFL
jgi:hypothetical protein